MSNGVSIRVYSSDFAQILKEFELTPVRNDFIVTTEVNWSPDGTMLAVSIQGQGVTPALQIWNVESSELVAQFTNVDPGATFAWNPQSTHIAVSHERGLGNITLRILDVINVNAFRDYDIDKELGYFGNIRWSPDGGQIALNTGSTLYLLNLENGQFRAFRVPIYGDFELPRYVFSPDGRYLLGVTDINALEAIILDMETDQIVGRLTGHTAQISSLNWVNRYIATVGYDGITKLWDPVSFEELVSLQTGITSVPSFNLDESAFVASANDFETVVVRDSETGAIIAAFDPIVLTPTHTPTPSPTDTPTATPTHTPTATPVPANLLLNPGFEEAGATSSDALHWTKGMLVTTDRRICNAPAEGSCLFRFSFSGSNNILRSISQTLPNPTWAGAGECRTVRAATRTVTEARPRRLGKRRAERS
jgi:WD40 repeat protein